VSEFNLELAEKVLQQIDSTPEWHIQSSPSYCVLGWVVKLGEVHQDFSGTESRAAEALGIDFKTARDIWQTMSESAAKRKLVRLIKDEKSARAAIAKAAAKAARKAAKVAAKQAAADAKRAARIEEETQRVLDLQAREQMRAHKRVVKAAEVEREHV
jgi:hypothetical protein